MKNLDIRRAISGNGLKHKDIARKLDITPEWLSRLLRFTLTQENKDRIMKAINELCDQAMEEGEINDVDS